MWRRMLAPAHDLPLALIVWPRLYRFDAHADTQEIAYQLATLPLPPVRARAKRYFSLTAATGAARRRPVWPSRHPGRESADGAVAVDAMPHRASPSRMSHHPARVRTALSYTQFVVLRRMVADASTVYYRPSSSRSRRCAASACRSASSASRVQPSTRKEMALLFQARA
jgi:hypothetical protein